MTPDDVMASSCPYRSNSGARYAAIHAYSAQIGSPVALSDLPLRPLEPSRTEPGRGRAALGASLRKRDSNAAGSSKSAPAHDIVRTQPAPESGMDCALGKAGSSDDEAPSLATLTLLITAGVFVQSQREGGCGPAHFLTPNVRL
jgi:hypothetical protein